MERLTWVALTKIYALKRILYVEKVSETVNWCYVVQHSTMISDGMIDMTVERLLPRYHRREGEVATFKHFKPMYVYL
jgi:hypothetical protein